MSVLAPEHLDDLKKSGLTSSTIEALGFAAVRPHDLNLRGVGSAYALPYFHLDGTTNDFKRLKIFPPIKTDHGTMRYWQSPGTTPHLYLPPLLSWHNVARHITTEFTITEGEKKAAAACQHGLITAAIGGAWNWTLKLDNGDKLTLPMLDEFQWSDRSVLICPDSDAWHDGKGMNILAGFFALAKDLQQRGANVQFVRLPDLHGTKAGLDDWLLIPGNDVEHGWPKLERISLDDPSFSTLTAWWQRRKEKQAAQTAIKQHDLDDLKVEETAGLFTVYSPTHIVSMIFDRLSETRNGITAEVTITVGATEVLSGVDVGLKSDSSQSKLAGSLKTLTHEIPWKLLLQRACSLVLKRHREGEPLRILTKDVAVEPLTYLLRPLVFKDKPSALYGDGGTGKSTLALACAMTVSVGGTLAGISALKGKALYLDYEDSYDVHVRRMKAIAAGHPDLAEAHVSYQACTEPLLNLAHPLLRQIRAEGITFLVLDSLVAATGGDASAEAAARIFKAIRTFGIGTLILAHVAKNPAEGQDPSIYGSVFNKNFTRATWELKLEQEVGEDVSILGLINRKVNLSRKHAPIGLKVTQSEESTRIHYEPFDLNQAAELKSSLPWPSQIRSLLEDGEPRSSHQIAEDLGAKIGVIKTTLSNPRYKGHKWHSLGEGRGTKWTVLSA